MLDTYNIQIFETNPTPVVDKPFGCKFKLLLDTSIVDNLHDHESIMKAINNVFNKENINTKDRLLTVYIDNFECMGYINCVRYLLTYDKNSSLIDLKYEIHYYKEFRTGIV